MLKLIVSKQEKGLLCVLLEEGKAVRLAWDAPEGVRLGDIYRARIQNIHAGVRGAFADIGPEHVYLSTAGRRLKKGEEVTVQISQEAQGLKLASVTEELSLPGHFLVVSSQPGMLSFSRRVDWSPAQKEEIGTLLAPWKQSFGFIVRTEAAAAGSEQIEEEASRLSERLGHILQRAAHSPAPARLYSGLSVWQEWLMGLDPAGLEAVITDDETIFPDMEAWFAEQGLPAGLLRLHEDKTLSLNALYNLERIRREASDRKVWLKSGAFLMIDRTEALTVIDVNSGKNEAGGEAEKTILAINREAAAGIARQLALRNLSGMIIVDFISMRKKENQDTLMSFLQEEVSKDAVYTRVVDMTPLGLVEMTRRRIRKPWQ